jgi:hypothetical protein
MGGGGVIADAMAHPGIISIRPFKRCSHQVFTIAGENLEVVIQT